MTSTIRLHALRLYGALCVQRGTPMLQSYADPRLLDQQGRVDIHNPGDDVDYQRTLVTARIKQTADYYEKGGRMPHPLLINIREDDFIQVQVVVDGGDTAQAEYDQAVAVDRNWIGSGFIEFSSDLPLWIYDGQHRRAGLQRLLEQDASFDDFPAPVSLTLGLDTQAEMTGVLRGQHQRKNVSTNLAFTLLSKMAEDPELREALAGADKDWITCGQAVMKELEGLIGPWKGRFQLANTRKRKGEGVIMPMQQFVHSLKPVLDMPLFNRADTLTIVNVGLQVFGPTGSDVFGRGGVEAQVAVVGGAEAAFEFGAVVAGSGGEPVGEGMAGIVRGEDAELAVGAVDF